MALKNSMSIIYQVTCITDKYKVSGCMCMCVCGNSIFLEERPYIDYPNLI